MRIHKLQSGFIIGEICFLMQMKSSNIKVFISSTFRDLNVERDYLVRKVFPEIRSNLDGISVSEVDLRWGITEEESHNKQVVDLCLQYLHESKPFFIGILGERYGTVISPNEVELSPLVEEVYPHVWDDLRKGLSITEIEILNGVLRAPSNKKLNAIFFIMETDCPYAGESEEKFQKLQSLKKRIIEQKEYPYFFYKELKDLDRVRDFVLNSLEKFLTKNTINTESIFNENHLYLERYRELPPDSYATLDNLMPVLECANPIAILEGIEGSGKSSLVAQLGHNYKGSNRQFIHMYGNVADITSTNSLFVDYFLTAAKKLLQEQFDREANQSNVKGWFKRTFQKVNLDVNEELVWEIKRHKWCVVLDNVNSLRLQTISPMLYILPAIINGFAVIKQYYDATIDFRILVVQSPGSPYSLSDEKDEKVSMPLGYSVNPQKFIDSYLSAYSKHLNAAQMQILKQSLLVTHPRSLYLVCEYMREFVSHEQLASFMNHISTFQNTSDAYRLFTDHLRSTLDETTLRRMAGILSLFSYGLNLRHLQELSGLNNLDFHRAWCSLKKLVTEEITGALHWTNDTIARFVDKEFNLTDKAFRSALAKDCARYFFKQLDNLYTPEKLIAIIRKAWWLWKSDLIVSIPEQGRDKTIFEIQQLDDMSLYFYLRQKGCFKSEHIRKYVYPQVLSRVIGQETQAAFMKARKQYKGKDTTSFFELMEQGELYNFYSDEYWDQITRYRKPTQVELLCYLEALCLCRNWKQLEVELANPEVLNYVWSTSVLLDCWNVGMSEGHISIIQPDMRKYDKMLLVSYALHNAEGIQYYSENNKKKH